MRNEIDIKEKSRGAIQNISGLNEEFQGMKLQFHPLKQKFHPLKLFEKRQDFYKLIIR